MISIPSHFHSAFVLRGFNPGKLLSSLLLLSVEIRSPLLDQVTQRYIMQNPFLPKFLQFMGSGGDSGSGRSGQTMLFLLSGSVINKRERLEELLERELISKVVDVEGENKCEPISCPFSN